MSSYFRYSCFLVLHWLFFLSRAPEHPTWCVGSYPIQLADQLWLTGARNYIFLTNDFLANSEKYNIASLWYSHSMILKLNYGSTASLRGKVDIVVRHVLLDIEGKLSTELSSSGQKLTTIDMTTFSNNHSAFFAVR